MATTTPTSNRLRLTIAGGGDWDPTIGDYPDRVVDVIVTIAYPDGAFDVIPVDATDDPVADFTVYPGEIASGRVIVEELAQ